MRRYGPTARQLASARRNIERARDVWLDRVRALGPTEKQRAAGRRNIALAQRAAADKLRRDGPTAAQLDSFRHAVEIESARRRDEGLTSAQQATLDATYERHRAQGRETQARVFELRDEGLSAVAIADELGVHKRTVYKYLRGELPKRNPAQ